MTITRKRALQGAGLVAVFALTFAVNTYAHAHAGTPHTAPTCEEAR